MKLKNLKVRSIDIVDQGASVDAETGFGADVKILKRAQSRPAPVHLDVEEEGMLLLQELTADLKKRCPWLREDAAVRQVAYSKEFEQGVNEIENAVRKASPLSLNEVLEQLATIESEFDRRARELVRKSASPLTREQAFARLFEQHPRAYERYAALQKSLSTALATDAEWSTMKTEVAEIEAEFDRQAREISDARNWSHERGYAEAIHRNPDLWARHVELTSLLHQG